MAMGVTFAVTVLFSGEAYRRDSAWVALRRFSGALDGSRVFHRGRYRRTGACGALGYAEVSFPAGIQVAALFGVYAVTFLLCLSANAVALHHAAAGGRRVAQESQSARRALLFGASSGSRSRRARACEVAAAFRR